MSTQTFGAAKEQYDELAELRDHNALLIDAVRNLTDMCVTQVGADYNDVIHAAYLNGMEALLGDQK